MMKHLSFYIFVLSCVMSVNGIAQDSFDSFRKKMNDSFDKFKEKKEKEYEAFRKRINNEYAALLEKTWKEYNAIAKIKVPENDISPIPPVIYPQEDDQKIQPEPKPLPYDEVVPQPQPQPKPQPVVPIETKPVPQTTPKVSFSFFGTQTSFRFDTSKNVYLKRTDERDIAKAWKEMSNEAFTNLLHDCLQERETKNLCDWAYLCMLQQLANKLMKKDNNSATLLMAYLYCQSGYKMRLAKDGANNLYMLYASHHIIYNKNYFNVDGEKYYVYGEDPKSVYICNISFPKETAMSLYIPEEPKFSSLVSATRTRQSERYPEVRVTMTSNKNLIDFYNTYPTSMIGDNLVSRWAMYAETPMSANIRQQIYPSLRAAIQDCDQLTAVNKLLNFVQTGFEYEYDDKVWGHDRAFFAEESLYYPYCDCEDRSILFTRLVRDLLGLKCILIYYPGHLASAVEFTANNVSGDYILLDGRKFIIADGTYINAPVGRTMPGMNNTTAKVILLK